MLKIHIYSTSVVFYHFAKDPYVMLHIRTAEKWENVKTTCQNFYKATILGFLLKFI